MPTETKIRATFARHFATGLSVEDAAVATAADMRAQATALGWDAELVQAVGTVTLRQIASDVVQAMV